MTREEAIKILRASHCDGLDCRNCENCVVGMAIADMEKQIPKKPIEYIMRFICPNCESLEIEQYNDIGGSTFFDYCPDCGQKLDWTPPYKRTDRLKGE